MTREDDFIDQVEGYLDEYEGQTPLPEMVRDAVRAQLPTTRQISPLPGPLRILDMTVTVPPAARYGLVAAAAVAAVIAGGALFGGPNLGGGPTPTPVPIPTPPILSGDALEAGTYRLTVVGVVATITVPPGWANVQGIGVGKDIPDVSFAAVVFWPSDEEVAHVYSDPCRWQDGYVDPPVGPTVDDLVTALANQPQRGESVPIDVSIDGYRGKMVELTVPDDIDFADCDGGQFYSWEGRFHQAPGQVDRIYVLDVDGRRLVIDAHFTPGTSAGDLAEQQAVLESIRLDGR
jgi:hypothetical protein